MTYCFGWKNANSVYLIGDSAVTKDSPPYTTHSSFGELHDMVGGRYVEETAIKIIPIGSGTAVAYAGDVQLARNIISFLKDNLGGSANIKALLASLNASLGPFDRDREVELLIATSTPNGESQLFHWTTDQGLNTANFDYCWIGSLTSYHSELTPKVLSWLAQQNLNPDDFLSGIIGLVQSYGVQDNLIKQNVGGLIFGLRTQEGNITWQEDTTFVIYDPSFQNRIHVSAFVRDNVVVVSSTATNDIRVISDSVSMGSSIDWIGKWGSQVDTHLRSDRYRYWIFIRMLERAVTVLRRNNLEQQSRSVSLKQNGVGKISFGVSENLRSFLTQPLRNQDDGIVQINVDFWDD